MLPSSQAIPCLPPEDAKGNHDQTPRCNKKAKDDHDQTPRSNKKAKRLINSTSPSKGNGGPVSFADIVTKGLGAISNNNAEAFGPDSTMRDEGEDQEEGYWTDASSEWDTDSENEEEQQKNPMCPTIVLSKEEKQRLRRPWTTSVILKLIGMNMGYVALSRRLRTLWKPSGTFDIIDLGNEFYIAKFGSKIDYEKFVSEGPWTIADHYLTVQK